MTDPDRGAYTPQTDAPLSFDPRRPNERRPVPMTLVGSAVVLVVLIAGVALVYRGGVRGAGEGPRPVGEPVMSVKTAAPPPARDAAGSTDAAIVASGATATPANPGSTETTRTTTTASNAPSGAGARGAIAQTPRPQSSTMQSSTAHNPVVQTSTVQTSTVQTSTFQGSETQKGASQVASAGPAPGSATGAPVFAPSPEQPAPRPPPRPRTVAALAPPTITSRTTTSTARTATTAVGPRPDTLDPSDVAAAGMTSRAAPKPTAKPAGQIVVADNDGATGRHGPRVGMPRRDFQANAVSPAGAQYAGARTNSPQATLAQATLAQATLAQATLAQATLAQATLAQATLAKATRVQAREPATGSGAAITPGASVVQIGAFSSTALADRGYAEVASALPGQMDGKSKHVQPLDHEGKTLFRTWVSGFVSRADAVAFCEALKARSKICIVKS